MGTQNYDNMESSKIGAAMPSAKRGDVHSNLDDLDSNLMLLSDNIQYLIEKLHPALNVSGLDKRAELSAAALPNATTPLGGRIAEFNQRVTYMRDAVNGATQSLEI